MNFYKGHREYLIVAIAANRYQMERTDERSNEAHRAGCRKIHGRLIVELDDYDTTQIEEALAVEAEAEIKEALAIEGAKV